MSSPWSAIMIPRSFVRYACERQLVCCRAPVRAPIPAQAEARIADVLTHASDEGRALAADLPHTITHDVTGARVWRQHDDGRCAHLRTAPPRPSCRLQDAGDFGALPLACQNFPRSITRVGDALEVVFTLACPTAARLLIEGAHEPFAWVALSDPAAWPYQPTRVAPPELRLAPDQPPASIAELLALRGAWWTALAEARHEPARLLSVLGAFMAEPLAPAAIAPSSALAALGAGVGIPLARRIVDSLGATPGRGAHYRQHFWPAFEGLMDAIRPNALIAAMEAAPELIESFVAHELAWGGLHETRPVTEHWRKTVRRAVVALRVVEALLVHVPLPTATLFRDAFAATPFFDP